MSEELSTDQTLATSDITASQTPEPINTQYAGALKISVVSSIGLVPIENATVTISYTGDPENTLDTLTTDNSGQTRSEERR